MGLDVMYAFLFISLYFEVFMLMAFIDSRRARAAHSPRALSKEHALPRVAIIVPCFNEEKTVAHTLDSLLALDYPADKLEIIVVDDGSKDATLEVAQSYAREVGITACVKVFHKENGGKHSAMNFALAHTEADLIGCLDADSVVSADALMHIAPLFADERIAAVIPAIHIKQPETLLQYMQEVEYRLSLFNRFTLAALGSTFITPGPFSIFRTELVRSMGGWRHGHSTEDLEMALRIQVAGHLIANAPRAQVFTGTPRTVRALIRQRVRWTYGFLRNAIDYRTMFGNKEFGNLGMIVLPSALVSIGIALFFFVRVFVYSLRELSHLITRTEILGFSYHPSFNLFYFNTSVLWILVWASVILVLTAVAIGSRIGTGKRQLPVGTPLFVLFYGFLAPVWLGMAVFRALFKTGVKWR